VKKNICCDFNSFLKCTIYYCQWKLPHTRYGSYRNSTFSQELCSDYNFITITLQISMVKILWCFLAFYAMGVWGHRSGSKETKLREKWWRKLKILHHTILFLSIINQIVRSEFTRQQKEKSEEEKWVTFYWICVPPFGKKIWECHTHWRNLLMYVPVFFVENVILMLEKNHVFLLKTHKT